MPATAPAPAPASARSGLLSSLPLRRTTLCASTPHARLKYLAPHALAPSLSASSPTHTGLCGAPLTVGNAAPVQLATASAHHPGRILVPHMRNMFEVWVTHSDDDGVSWSPPRQVPGVVRTDPIAGPACNRSMAYFGLKNAGSYLAWIEELGWSKGANPFDKWGKYLTGPWQYVGLGPPGSIQLRGKGGRVVVPAYHSFIRGLSGGAGQGAGVALPISQLYNNFALGHVMYSDDGGDTWKLSSGTGFGGGAVGGSFGANENQLVQLLNGSILVNSRSLSTGSPQRRVQAICDDPYTAGRGTAGQGTAAGQGTSGQGTGTAQGGFANATLSFSPTRFVEELPEPFNGCQGSIVASVVPGDGSLFFSHPNPRTNSGIAPDILKLLGADVNLTGRDHMTVWSSKDHGASFQVARLIDEGASGYSSLQAVRATNASGLEASGRGGSGGSGSGGGGGGGGDGGARTQRIQGGNSVWLLYEQSDRAADSFDHLGLEALIGALSVLNPDRFVLRLIEDL